MSTELQFRSITLYWVFFLDKFFHVGKLSNFIFKTYSRVTTAAIYLMPIENFFEQKKLHNNHSLSFEAVLKPFWNRWINQIFEPKLWGMNVYISFIIWFFHLSIFEKYLQLCSLFVSLNIDILSAYNLEQKWCNHRYNKCHVYKPTNLQAAY